MNQTIVDVNLCESDQFGDELVFEIQSDNNVVQLNSDSCQKQLKEVFSELLKTTIENDVILNLKIPPDYSKGLYKDVCKEYIAELQKELDSIKDKIRRDLKE